MNILSMYKIIIYLFFAFLLHEKKNAFIIYNNIYCILFIYNLKIFLQQWDVCYATNISEKWTLEIGCIRLFLTISKFHLF